MATQENKNQRTQYKENSGGAIIAVVIAWLWAGIPLAWGVYQTLIKAVDLFK